MSLTIQNNVELARYTSWLVGGLAEHFCQPQSEEELKEALHWSIENSKLITVLGGGSNVLISDSGVKGLVINLKKLSGCEIKEEEHRLNITCWAGTTKSELLKIFLKHKLAPALFLAGLPGDVGGGVVMNAGVSESFVPREFCELVDWVEVLRIEGKQIKNIKFNKSELKWSYRHSHGWQPGVVLRAGLSWPLEPNPQILEQVKNANKVRLTKQPLDMPSCGSVFINPEGHKAAQLIDSCGLKGFQIGGAQVSLKHANFIVNLGSAKASDIWQVIEHVQKVVENKTGVQLKTEVIRMGEVSQPKA